MPLTAVVPQRELAYQAAQLFVGQTFKVFLALNSGSLTPESTVAAWEAVECSGGGYAAATGTIAAGAWNSGTARFEMPTVTINVTATGGGFTYDTIVTKIGSRTYCANVTSVSPSVALAAGQSRTYTVQLAQDD